MILIGYIVLAWVAVSALAAFGWVIFFELCARRSRAGRPRRGVHPPAHAPRTRIP